MRSGIKLNQRKAMPNCRILYFYKKLVSVRDTPPPDGVGVLLSRGDKKECENVKFYYNRAHLAQTKSEKLKTKNTPPPPFRHPLREGDL